MGKEEKVLTSSETRTYYNHFGKWQDLQGVYEDPALDDLTAHANFQEARKVFEFGCGTGKYASQLLAQCLPSTATYIGCDISPVMVALAVQRLENYAERAKVVLSGGAVKFPLSEYAVDRLVSSYVLDLLSDEDIRAFFKEAYRVLTPGGKLCVVSLTKGATIPARIVSLLWTAAFRVRASLVGGCRPLRLDPYISKDIWHLEHRRVITSFWVPSEVFVLTSKSHLTR